jgi:hypothetical protein
MAFNPKGFTGTVNDVEYAKIIGPNGEHGITGDYLGTGFAASSISGVRQMLVQPGTLAAPGVIGELTSATVSPVANPLPGGSNSRIDLLVAAFNWTSKTVILDILEGAVSSSPVPPAPIQNPGSLFHVPIAQGLLTPTSSGAYATVNIKVRRYWVEGGKFVLPSTTQLPPAAAGAVAIRPDSHQLLVCNGPSWDTYKAEDDSGWETVSLAAPGGFTGSVKGRIKNGLATLQFNWTKAGGTITNTDFTVAFPSKWWPSGIDISRGVFAANSPVRVYFSQGNGQMTFNNVTISPGNILGGGFTYFVN